MGVLNNMSSLGTLARWKQVDSLSRLTQVITVTTRHAESRVHVVDEKGQPSRNPENFDQ